MLQIQNYVFLVKYCSLKSYHQIPVETYPSTSGRHYVSAKDKPHSLAYLQELDYCLSSHHKRTGRNYHKGPQTDLLYSRWQQLFKKKIIGLMTSTEHCVLASSKLNNDFISTSFQALAFTFSL